MTGAGGFQFSQKCLDKAKTDSARAQSIIFVHQSLSQGGEHDIDGTSCIVLLVTAGIMMNNVMAHVFQ